MPLFIHSKLRSRTPVPRNTGVLWRTIAAEALGTAYDLSVVLIGDTRMHRLNKLYRGKDRPTNVLAFLVGDATGEIYIDVPYARRESGRYGHSPAHHLTYLFIHGLVHLKGLDHGPAMERLEERLFKKFVR